MKGARRGKRLEAWALRRGDAEPGQQAAHIVDFGLHVTVEAEPPRQRCRAADLCLDRVGVDCESDRQPWSIGRFGNGAPIQRKANRHASPHDLAKTGDHSGPIARVEMGVDLLDRLAAGGGGDDKLAAPHMHDAQRHAAGESGDEGMPLTRCRPRGARLGKRDRWPRELQGIDGDPAAQQVGEIE